MPVTINGSNTPTAGGVVYGDGSAYASTTAGSAGSVLYSAGASAPAFTAVGTAGYLLQSNGAAAPSWVVAPSGGSSATPTAEGIVYGKTNTTNLTFLGYGAGTSNTGTYNTFIGGKDDYYGISAGGSNTSGNYNTAVGSGSIPKNVTGSNITSVGMDAGQNTTAGPY